jgi:hypothetical protein
MEEALIVVLVVYIIVGAVVYFLTDTTTFASRIESATPLPWGLVESSVFAFVVALWPVWLLLGSNVGSSKRAKRP